MSSRAELLAEKRRALQARCAVERDEIRFRHDEVEAQLRIADRIINVARGIVKNPLVIGAAVVGVAMLGPFRIIRWVSQSVFFWSAARRLGGYLLERDASATKPPQ